MAFFSRTPAQVVRTGTPLQQQFQDQSLQQALAILQGGSQGQLNPIGQQALNRFQTQTVPGLAERFTAMGGGGPGQSSAFQGALGQAASGLSQDLAAQQYGILGQLGQLGQGGTLFQPEEPGFLENFLTQILGVAPSLLSSYFGTPGFNFSSPMPQQRAQGYTPPFQTSNYKQSMNQALSLLNQKPFNPGPAGYNLGGAPLPPQAP